MHNFICWFRWFYFLLHFFCYSIFFKFVNVRLYNLSLWWRDYKLSFCKLKLQLSNDCTHYWSHWMASHGKHCKEVFGTVPNVQFYTLVCLTICAQEVQTSVTSPKCEFGTEELIIVAPGTGPYDTAYSVSIVKTIL